MPKAPSEAAKPAASEQPPGAAEHSAAEAKPAPIRPYIRNQRPTVFDRSPEPAPAKPSDEAASEVDSAAVEQMKASVEAAGSGITSDPAHQEASRAGDSSEGENLEFDFNDETRTELGAEPDDNDEAPAAAAHWSVGEDAEDKRPARTPGFGSGELDPGFSRGAAAPIGRGTIPQYAGSPPPQHAPLPDERAFMERAELRSARSFIGLFFAVGLVFVAVTLVIAGIPSASAGLLRRMPVIGPEFVQSPRLENLLSVSDVQSNYQTVKGGRAALVVVGAVKNNSTIPLHTVQIGVRLLDAAQRELANSAVYVGTTLSPRMISEMTPHELEFLQKLDPQKTFVLAPGHAAPFLMVFIDPPREVRHLALAIAKAQPPALVQTSQASARP